MHKFQANALLSEAAGPFHLLYPIFNNVGWNQINIHYHFTAVVKPTIIINPTSVIDPMVIVQVDLEATVTVHKTVPPFNFVCLAVIGGFTVGVGFAM